MGRRHRGLVGGRGAPTNDGSRRVSPRTTLPIRREVFGDLKGLGTSPGRPETGTPTVGPGREPPETLNPKFSGSSQVPVPGETRGSPTGTPGSHGSPPSPFPRSPSEAPTAPPRPPEGPRVHGGPFVWGGCLCTARVRFTPRLAGCVLGAGRAGPRGGRSGRPRAEVSDVGGETEELPVSPEGRGGTGGPTVPCLRGGSPPSTRGRGVGVDPSPLFQVSSSSLFLLWSDPFPPVARATADGEVGVPEVHRGSSVLSRLWREPTDREGGGESWRVSPSRPQVPVCRRVARVTGHRGPPGLPDSGLGQARKTGSGGEPR